MKFQALLGQHIKRDVLYSLRLMKRSERLTKLMFLKCAPNPHQSGRMTRAVFFNTTPDQRFAIDAETLHRNPHLLNTFSPGSDIRFKMLDCTAYMVCVLGVLGSLAITWWMFVPGIAVCAMMLATNRKAAGDIARRSASRSKDAFRRLHELGVMWLVPASA